MSDSRQVLLIVYHSQSGTCARMARAAAEAAGEGGEVEVRVRRACDAAVTDLAAAGGLLLVAAENAGYLAGGMKEFIDRVFYPAIDRELLLPYALLVSAGNDGRNAVAQAQRLLRGIPLTQATEPVICRGEWCEAHAQRAGELGEAFATGLSMGVF
ncbi:flavodoxin domain-containing protein [Haliea sp. E17]|uniref:flavodoxin domain-containing protein n=1 Tax=Haliea sp. E17 TaxID=3401576 RepID=UPI003AACFCE2